MKILNKSAKFLALLLIVVVQFVFTPVKNVLAVTPPDRGLGTADSYAVFGKAGVTNTGAPTHIWGNVGADSSVIGLTAPQVDGTINTPAPSVQTDASSTFDSLMSATQGTPSSLDLAGTNTIGPGVYNVAATTLNGALTLDGAGVYIFRSSSSNTTAHSGTMNLINGASACNVFWAVSASMTIGVGAHVVGTIIAQTGLISLGTNATLQGRAISLTQQVTLDSNQITQPTCTAPTTAPSSSSSTSSDSSSGASSNSCPVIDPSVVAPSVISSRRISPTSIFISWGPYSGVNTFNIQYGPTNGNWLYNTNATGFSTTINDLPANQPMWFRVAARNDCTIGDYGPATLVGSASSSTLVPGFPNTGVGPKSQNDFWNPYLPFGIAISAIASIFIVFKKRTI